MSFDITVPPNTVLELSATTQGPVAAAREIVQLRTLRDLQKHGLISELDGVSKVLDAAKVATEAALHDVSVHSLRRLVPGTRNLDLGRYARVRAAAPKVDEATTGLVWRMLRDEKPATFAAVGLDTPLVAVKELMKWKLRDVIVESGATLVITGNDAHLSCHDLVIKKNGVVKLNGLSLHINATSVKGDA